jgi:uncharacterized protein (TIGR00369 family)
MDVTDEARRVGWFWDMADGRHEPPPAARLLGFAMTRIDPDRGEVDATFSPSSPDLLNNLGRVQGGFLGAMLDTVLGAAIYCMLPPNATAPTLELKVSYLRPVLAGGRLSGHARVVHRGSSVAFLEGELREADSGNLVATATSTVRIQTRP